MEWRSVSGIIFFPAYHTTTWAMQPQKNTLMTHLIAGVREHHSVHTYVNMSLLHMVYGFVRAAARYLEFSVVNNIRDPESVLLYLYGVIICWALTQLVWHVSLVQTRRYLNTLEQFFLQKYLLLLFKSSDLTWLHGKDTGQVFTAVEKGVSAMREMVNFGLSIQAPMLEVIANSVLLYTYVDYTLFPFIGVMYLLIFVAGFSLLRWDFTKTSSHKRVQPSHELQCEYEPKYAHARLERPCRHYCEPACF